MEVFTTVSRFFSTPSIFKLAHF
ncbi:hypothetical protein LINPERPRIM_LOCUS4330 [Linum perenne]